MAASVVLLLALQLFLTVNGAAAIPMEELDSMFPVLSSSGYNRIANAIATSDLSLDFLSTETITLFAPSDASLFALDMALEASSYISVLRSHVTPRRLSVSDLRLLPGTCTLLPTLLQNRFLNVTVHRERAVTTITVNGLGLVFPGLYYGNHVAVHGLAGALTFVSDGGSPSDSEVDCLVNDSKSNLINSPPPPNPLAEPQEFLPSTETVSVLAPAAHTTAAPPVQAAIAPVTTSIVITDPSWLWPEVGDGGQPPHATAQTQLPEIGDGSDPPPRRRLPATRRWSRIELPALARREKVDGKLKRQERILIQATTKQPETILPLKEVIATDHHLHRTLLESYSSNPYGVWNDPLCIDGCECLHC